MRLMTLGNPKPNKQESEMKLHKTIGLLTLTFILIPLGAEQVLLARFDLAGMPVETLPEPASILTMIPEEPDQGTVLWQVLSDGILLGYIPARLTDYLETLLQEGYRLQLQLSGIHNPARPGRFVQVELWCRLRDREDIPIWTEPVAEDHARFSSDPDYDE